MYLFALSQACKPKLYLKMSWQGLFIFDSQADLAEDTTPESHCIDVSRDSGDQKFAAV